jgi:hypothetical protein
MSELSALIRDLAAAHPATRTTRSPVSSPTPRRTVAKLSTIYGIRAVAGLPAGTRFATVAAGTALAAGHAGAHTAGAGTTVAAQAAGAVVAASPSPPVLAGGRF